MPKSDYSRDMYKQLEELIEKYDKLNVQVNKQEKDIKYLEENNERLNKENKKLKKELKEVKEKNQQLEEELERTKKKEKELQNENDRLRGITIKDSRNSSIPPSKDMKYHKIQNLRDKSEKKIGGQKKHKGKTLTQEHIDKLVKENKIKKKIVEHGNPKNKICIRKSIVDIETRVIVTEHRFYFDSQKEIKIPKEYITNVQYGDNIKNLCNMLVVEETVSLERIEELIKEITGKKLEISQGTIVNWIRKKAKECEKTVEEIKRKIQNGKLIYTDATTTSLKGKPYYIRNYSNDKYTLYEPCSKERKEAMLGEYSGYLMHDHETGVYSYGRKERHGECNVHLRRYLKYNVEQNPENTWSKELDELLLKIKEDKEKMILEGQKEFKAEYLAEVNKKYDSIIKKGKEENRKKRDVLMYEEKRLLNRLEKYKENHLLFATNFEIPFDNNLSERDLRKIKTKKKISGCFRAENMIEAYCKIQTVISSCKKQNINIFDTLKNIGIREVSL